MLGEKNTPVKQKNIFFASIGIVDQNLRKNYNFSKKITMDLIFFQNLSRKTSVCVP
jgi:hypothetical protein